MPILTAARPVRNPRHAFGAGILPSREEIDAAWYLGLDLGRRGVDGRPRRSWASEVRAAFHDGYAEGQLTRSAEESDEFERQFASLVALNGGERGE